MKCSLFLFCSFGLFSTNESAGCCFDKKDRVNAKEGGEIQQKSPQKESETEAKEEEKPRTLKEKIELYKHHILQFLGKAQQSDIGLSKLSEETSQLLEEGNKIRNENPDILRFQQQRKELSHLNNSLNCLCMVAMEAEDGNRPTTEMQKIALQLKEEQRQIFQKAGISKVEQEFHEKLAVQFDDLLNLMIEAKEKCQKFNVSA